MRVQGRQGGRSRVARTLRMAPVAAVVLAAGLLSGPGSQADEGQPTVEIAYDCAVPDHPSSNASGTPDSTDATPSAGTTLRASVRIGTQLPSSAEPGRPIRPGDVTVETDLPFAGLASLLPPDTDGLAGDASLGVRIRQGAESADATWSALTAGASTPPPTDTLRLGHTGPAPTVTVSKPGDVDLYATELSLRLSPLTQGMPKTDTAFTLDCAPADKDPARTRLAHISVPDGTGPTGTPSASAPDGTGAPREGLTVTPQDSGTTGADTCPPPPPTGVADLSQLPEPLPGTVLGPLLPHPGVPACAYAVGLSTVRKQNSSMIINDPAKEPGLMNIRAAMQTQFWKSGHFYTRIDSLGELDLPDAESTFLSFGFTPVTARVSFKNEPITISTGTIGVSPNAMPFAVATFFQSLRVHDVKINGTPLDVNPSCHTERYRATLRGDFTSTTGRYINVLSGGILKGTVDIPAFTGCGANGENLDRLFTAGISGPGNDIIMNQAPTCIPGPPRAQCPPVIPPLPGGKTS